MRIQCTHCGVVKERPPSGAGRFCSPACFYAARRRSIQVTCIQCGVTVERTPSKGGKFCSIACRDESLRNKIARICVACKAPFDARPSTVKDGNGRFCSRKCAWTVRSIPLRERFEAIITRDANAQGCWAIGSNRNHGSMRPKMRVASKTTPVCHVAWLLYRGEIPDEMWVLHRCPGGANGWCVNPEHLYLGTSADNGRDRLADGRAPWLTNPERIRRGETHPCAKLTTAQVEEIRTRYAAGGISQVALGAEYGVRGTAVNRIIHRKRRALG